MWFTIVKENVRKKELRIINIAVCNKIFLYEPGNRIKSKLPLRRTLVRSYHCSAKKKAHKSATQRKMHKAIDAGNIKKLH